MKYYRLYPFQVTLIIVFIMSISFSQEECPCCSDAHRGFDFWVGEWTVLDSAGTFLGENTVKILENNCIISEHWRGAQGGTGRSTNYFDPVDSTWNQLWIDNQGRNLILKGKAQMDRMILRSELLPGQLVDPYRNQITWTANRDGTVTQLWEILDAGDSLLTTAFVGIYHRNEGDAHKK